MAPDNVPFCVVADDNGNIFEIPGIVMTGMSLARPMVPGAGDIMPLPAGSDLFVMPGRTAIGYALSCRRFVEIGQYRGRRVHPVAAFVAPGHMQVLASACVPREQGNRLPLYCYTAAGWRDGKFYAACACVDRGRRHAPSSFTPVVVRRAARKMKKKYPCNRIVRHLIENCIERYDCPNAKNFALVRWECGIPVSTKCNSRCLGCISRQPSTSGCCASHDRLSFTPTPEEIAAIAVPHLQTARRAIVSFGQGCEGEPLCEAGVLEEAIRMIRSRTKRGVIHMNTNGSMPDRLERLFAAGLDSIRVSINSAQKRLYTAYHAPQGYCFSDVLKSIKTARRYKKLASINYLIFPGLTDSASELASLESLIVETGASMLQIRNLSIDPEWYIDTLGLGKFHEKAMGMRQWLMRVRRRFPSLKIGCFNPACESMRGDV